MAGGRPDAPPAPPAEPPAADGPTADPPAVDGLGPGREPPERRRGRRWPGHRFEVAVAGIAAAGLVGRLAYIALAKRPVDTCGRPRCGDAVYYMAQAWRLAEAGRFDDPANPGMPAADHPPLTALVLTPAAMVRDQTVLGGRITMALVGTATIVVLAVLARRLAGDAAGVATAALAALNPNLWMNDALPMSEAPAALAVALVLLALHRLLDAPSWGRAAALGALCGVAVLTRGELALLVPLTIAPAVLARAGPGPARTVGGRLAMVAVVSALGVAVVAPWTAWNLTRFEEPVLLSTNDGLTVVGANCAATYEGGGTGFWNLTCARDLEAQVPPGADQSVRSELYRREGTAYLRANADRLPTVVAVRVGRLWGLHHPEQMVWLNQGEGRERWASWAGWWAMWAMLPLAVAGGVVLRRQDVPIWPLASTAVLATLTAAAFYGIARFRLPFDVAETVLAGVALAAATTASVRKRSSRAAARPAPDATAPADAARPEATAGG